MKQLFFIALLVSCKEVVHEVPCDNPCLCGDIFNCELDCVNFPQFFPECFDCASHPESTLCCPSGPDLFCCEVNPSAPGCCELSHCSDNPHPNHGGPGDFGLPCANKEFCGTEQTPDGFDNDCDGIADNANDCNCASVDGDQLSCYTGIPGTRGVGECHDGIALCEAFALDGSETWGACIGQQLPLPNDDCGADGNPPRDTNCNGIVGDGCSGLVVTCSPEIFAAPLQTVNVAATITPSTGVVNSTTWAISSRPFGSSATPTTPNGTSSDLAPDLLGDYVMTFTAQDSDGLSGACSTVIHATSSEALRIELSWSTPAANIDVHLLHPDATKWYDPVLDCNPLSCNDNLPWSTAELFDDPILAIHDESGFGPENINIQTPELNRTYRIGAYAFDSVQDGPSDVSARVFCGGTLKAQLTHQDLIGSAINTPPNQLWKIADVTFITESTCNLVPLDQIIQMGGSGAPR